MAGCGFASVFGDPAAWLGGYALGRLWPECGQRPRPSAGSNALGRRALPRNCRAASSVVGRVLER